MPSMSNDNFFGMWPRNDNYVSTTFQFSRTTPSTPRSTPNHSRRNSPASLPSSPISVSPPMSTSPLATMRRNYSSTFTLIPEDSVVDIPPSQIFGKSMHKPAVTGAGESAQRSLMMRAIVWLPALVLAYAKRIFSTIASTLLRPFSFVAPTFLVSASLWMSYKIASLPLAIVKYVIIALHTPATERNRKKRTVLISCGSTIQTLHLARNFYSAGTRVVVFDFEGVFGLARFSTAVSKYYTVPKPSVESANDYITALCNIVEREQPSYYVPVSATSVAYYDALAKPHLELLGCTSFVTGTQEVLVLDDIAEVLRKCERHNIAVPPYRVATHKDDILRLYESGWLLGGYRNILMASGHLGILERQKYELPVARRDFRMPQEMSDERPWIVIRDLPGTHYITCTTVKDSQVVANVTCSVQQETRSLVPDDNKDVERWLTEFFGKVRLQRPINAHISFRFVRCQQTGALLPLGTRMGVSLPYICHTGVHSRILCKPCPHFTRQNSGPIVQEGGRYWIHELVLNTLKHPSVDAVGKLIGTVLDKREALFVYWDPLPYCAYYHFQLPFRSVKAFLRRHSAAHRHRPALAVH